ncbi:iron complex transport system substrate-binding protein [Maritimibacter alkaliphilus HTCC2654]|uniref:Hemin binding protein n=1 Tax=Maritimibacter alkaliphilus HTCC2654 TaxID=314271 RepID=A3VB33_9RHOB|nr:ABC transporter substrate-binding protein [Maritimibacter alkaliphilus]EAQ14146.1 hemin binding protein [Rhodobacterales bacterium HTCC2654] [Maritimibacter alkaliphilus HTCC2654]TYP84539.1 iron complex transport system substrate-binding protein [Maritimibacter alkaliphilus HTCC2654]
MKLSTFAFAAALTVTPVAGLADRVLSIGGSVTEIVYALGEGDRLVARDSTSNFPAEAVELPDVGYIRQLSAEGVLSVAPDLILMEGGAGPAETIDLLREAEIPMVEVADGYTPEAVEDKIRAVAKALNVRDKGEALAAEVRAQIAEARATVSEGVPRVLFVLSQASGRIMAAGEGTSAEAIIELAGGENALTGFQGYKQISEEAVMAAAPDVILMMDREGDHAVANDELFSQPAFASTPAAEGERVVRMDGLLLLGFGPRVGEAVSQLAAALHGDEG